MNAILAIVGALTALPVLASPPIETTWNTLCVPCHGVDGRGDGPAADLMWPRPTDLTGALPLGDDADAVRRAVMDGVPGTMMPAFRALEPHVVAGLVDRVRAGRSDAAPPVDEPMPAASGDDRGGVLWSSAGCAACHDARPADLVDADGGPADVYDLRSTPLKGGAAVADVFRAITRGRPGTPMPPFAHLPAADRRALAEWIVARRSGSSGLRAPPRRARAVARDAWWGTRPLPSPPDPGPDVPPPLVDGAPEACAVCHPAQYDGWRQSRHAAAAGPGLTAQDHGASPGTIARCNACHAPRAVQQADAERRRRGVTCAGCHLRAHRKHGPPGPSSMRLPAPGMAAQADARFGRSDLCMPCHNLPLSAAIDGRPLLDTWREWAMSPYLPAGVQCQHCHQPGGAHHMPGAHDPDTVRHAVRLEVDAVMTKGGLEVDAVVRNVGAGHHFPTTATPRAVLRIRQLAPEGPLPATEASWAIGRTVTHASGTWREVADTRIPAGEAIERRYRHPRHARATRVEVSLHMFPDWFYARFYRARLARKTLDADARAQFEVALAEAEASPFLIDFRRLPITGP